MCVLSAGPSKLLMLCKSKFDARLLNCRCYASTSSMPCQSKSKFNGLSNRPCKLSVLRESKFDVRPERRTQQAVDAMREQVSVIRGRLTYR